MISNKTILEKLNAKTEGNLAIRNFLTKALENETEGKQYLKSFTKWIKQCVKDEDGGEEQ